MKVVALISGGKDSCYNMMCCKTNGHEVVCLGNLFPGQTHEIDSYMYQSVGHEGIKMIAEAINLPLFRQEISGKPKSIEMPYVFDESDEVEDLYTLLKTIQEKFPDVRGVSVGAINSTYQKERVENVCARLNLTPLCYLWERNQLELFDEMQTSRNDLQQMREHLIDMHNKYGSHICGEGGEFETFVVDCPLYNTRISIDHSEVVIHGADQNIAPVAYLKLTELSLKQKE
uniref:Diphthine--ammonia ligase n=1 Tax=Ditylenchus dipsaci TaxID=166011 RepID=A0A915E2Z6_9BILA